MNPLKKYVWSSRDYPEFELCPTLINIKWHKNILKIPTIDSIEIIWNNTSLTLIPKNILKIPKRK